MYNCMKHFHICISMFFVAPTIKSAKNNHFHKLQASLHYAEENTFFFMRGLKGGPRYFCIDVSNVFQKFQHCRCSKTIVILYLKIGSPLRGPKFQNHFFSKLRPDSDSSEILCVQSEFHWFKVIRTTSNEKKNIP